MSQAAGKARLRSQVLAGRRDRTVAGRAADAEALAHRILTLPELATPLTVAVYASFGSEPGTEPLLAGLARAGHRLLLPVLLPDRDLDWAEDGQHRGVDAIRAAGVVVCPGLAADSTGVRLGRGGGSYDRALARCGTGTLRVLLLYDGELLESVPAAPHDQRVDVVVTPSRTVRIR